MFAGAVSPACPFFSRVGANCRYVYNTARCISSRHFEKDWDQEASILNLDRAILGLRQRRKGKTPSRKPTIATEMEISGLCTEMFIMKPRTVES